MNGDVVLWVGAGIEAVPEPKLDLEAFRRAMAAYGLAWPARPLTGPALDLFFAGLCDLETRHVVNGIMRAIREEEFPPPVAALRRHALNAQREEREHARALAEREAGRARLLAWQADCARRERAEARLQELRARAPLNGADLVEALSLDVTVCQYADGVTLAPDGCAVVVRIRPGMHAVFRMLHREPDVRAAVAALTTLPVSIEIPSDAAQAALEDGAAS